jgi:hypothetical protein
MKNTTDPIEKLQRKQERIEHLLREEFSGSNAPPPPSSLNAPSNYARSSYREDQEAWEQRQNARAARRAELLKMPDDEFDAIEKKRNEDAERDRLRREQQTPSAQEPDVDFWSREDEWSLVRGPIQ